MLIDTHCHLDATEFNADRENIALGAKHAGVHQIVVPAVARENFQIVIDLAHQYSHCFMALGIHPIYVDSANPSDLTLLKQLISQQLTHTNPKIVAVGEIGLDFFVTQQNRETQEYFFVEQLKIAQTFELPVILHVRRAIDDVLKQLRRHPVVGGIAHAFNGSPQQAEAFIQLGFKLGFGGAMTYTRALKIRELARNLPIESIVLETDAPDIPPEWLGTAGRNSPEELIKIAQVFADLRGIPVSQIIEITGKNVMKILPNLASLCTPLKVLH
ncbi:MAG: TatD family hydrolase [Methylotenera sp.]|nr:TatD family hydrolase [Methylotenera sp.]